MCGLAVAVALSFALADSLERGDGDDEVNEIEVHDDVCVMMFVVMEEETSNMEEIEGAGLCVKSHASGGEALALNRVRQFCFFCAEVRHV